jgi:cytochrome c oxidase cbb3-type subunit 4
MIVVRTVLTLILFSAFIGLWIWAWSKHRRHEFDAAAMLPLLDGERELQHDNRSGGNAP